MPQKQQNVCGKEIFTRSRVFILAFVVIFSQFTLAQQQDEEGNTDLPATQQPQTQPQESVPTHNRHIGVNDEIEAGPARMAGPSDDIKGQCASDGGHQVGSESNGIRCAIPDGIGGQKEFFYTKHGVKPVEDDYGSAQMANCLNGNCKQAAEGRQSSSTDNRSNKQTDDTYNSADNSQSQKSSFNNSSPNSSTEDDLSRSSPYNNSNSSSASTYSGSSGDDLQGGLNRCAQATTDAEAACDEKSNKDMSSFSSGVGRLLGMMGNRGLANTPGSCALLGAIMLSTCRDDVNPLG